MLISRLIHPDAIGRLTENGNRIGEFTLEGTVALIIFGGLLSGILGGIVWTLIRPWATADPVLVGLAAVALGGSFLVEADNRDFVILGNPIPDIVLLVGLVFLFGVTVAWLDDWLDRRLPKAEGTRSAVTYALMVLLAAPLMIPLFGSFFSQDFCGCEHPPRWIGVFFGIAAVASVTWWMLHLRGSESPPRWLRLLGSGAVVMAVVLGAVRLGTDINAIV